MTGSAPRVLWLAKGLGRGGAEMLLLELARTMDPTAVHLELAYVLPHKNALVPALEDAGVVVHLLGNGGPVSWLRPLRRLLVSGHYDVVHTHAPVIASAARLLACPETVLAHTEHNVWGRYRLPTRWANALTIHRNTVVWAVSRGVASSIRPWIGGPSRTHVEVMLHGITPSSIAHGPHAREEARRRLGLPDGAYVVGTVGNLTVKKDHETLLRAFRVFCARHDEAHLVIVGTGSRAAQLQGYAASLGLSHRVHFTGMREDVPQLLAGFDVFAMSSLHEGLSIALVEALAAGLPIVATRVGGIPELVVDGQHGLLVPARDDRALASAIERLSTDQALRERFSKAAVNRAAAFGIQNAATTLTAEYTRLSSGPRAEAVTTS
jgi:glycosyltransferase involved in cell wall biosynthesis